MVVGGWVFVCIREREREKDEEKKEMGNWQAAGMANLEKMSLNQTTLVALYPLQVRGMEKDLQLMPDHLHCPLGPGEAVQIKGTRLVQRAWVLSLVSSCYRYMLNTVSRISTGLRAADVECWYCSFFPWDHRHSQKFIAYVSFSFLINLMKALDFVILKISSSCNIVQFYNTTLFLSFPF